jgi:hypothetical protein
MGKFINGRIFKMMPDKRMQRGPRSELIIVPGLLFAASLNRSVGQT